MYNLEKGDSFNLEKSLTNIHVGLGWDVSVDNFDCDVSVFMINENHKLPNPGCFVFYNNLTSSDGSVKHLGDNRTGDGDGDDEVINIELNKVDQQIVQIIFVVTVHKAAEKGFHFGMIDNAFIRIEDKNNGKELCRYSLNNQYSGSDSLQVGRVYRYGDEWNFEAMGDGFSGGLASVLNIYK
jgi:tellurium resistance protein TerD